MRHTVSQGQRDARRSGPAILAAAASATLLALSSGAFAEARPVKVAELFTSQGCSSVPPANRNLAALDADKDLLTLSFSVNYWDYLGWKDTFGRQTYTDRQRAYEPALGKDGPFTPQIVVNGARDVIGNKAPALQSLLADSRPLAATPIDVHRDAVMIGPGKAPAGGADVWVVRYDPRTVDVPIARGENAGTVLPVSHPVRDLMRVGAWTGAPVRFPISAGAAGLRTAVLVQSPNGGPILSAATD